MNLGMETEYIEFKESLSQLSRGLEALSAMLNKHGQGTVYFGVKDNGDVIGQSIGNKTIKDINEAVTSRIRPAVIPTIEIVDYEGKNVITVSVSGNNKPYSSDGRYLLRSGNENKQIDPDIMRGLVFSNSADSITEIEAQEQELSFSQLKQLFITNGLTIQPETFEKNAGLFSASGRYNLLASLLSDRNDWSIKVVRFRGNDKTDMAYRNEYGYKCLLLAMQDALNFALSLNQTRVEVNESAQRKQTPLFHGNALREAWLNACLHTRWDKMVPPAIYVYSDRMEIVSTGGLALDYSKEDFYLGISHPTNRHLQKIMGQLGYVEQTGHGVPTIIREYGKDAFDISDNRVIVTLRFPYDLPLIETDYSSLSIPQRKILQAISNDPSITVANLSRVSGLGTSRVTVLLKELKELGRIQRIGAKKKGYWMVA